MSLPRPGLHTNSPSLHSVGATHAPRPKAAWQLSRPLEEFPAATGPADRPPEPSSQCQPADRRARSGWKFLHACPPLPGHSLTGVRMGRSGWQAAESRSCSTKNSTRRDSASFTEPAQPDCTSFPTFSFASVALPGFAPHSRNLTSKMAVAFPPESLLLLLVRFLLAAQSLVGASVGSTLGWDCHCSFRGLGRPLKPSGLQSPYP